MRGSFKRISLLFMAMIAASSCGEVRQDLGLGRTKPDEFSVTERLPLSVPPDFSLRPPSPGTPRPQEKEPHQQANEALFGTANVEKSSSASSSEKTLLNTLGAESIAPDIRSMIDREAQQKASASPHLVERLLNWNEGSATTVDAPAEAERIKKAKDSGETINKGATPVIEKKSGGWLGS